MLVAINQKDSEIREIFTKFQKLAKTGLVPEGFPSGHKDGWGLGAFKNSKLEFIKKESKDAFQNFEYGHVVNTIANIGCDIVVGHMRKSSIGNISIENTHPFCFKNFLFCQNGTIFDSEKLRIRKKFAALIKGSTDSERFFIYILQSISGIDKDKKISAASVREGILSAVSFARKDLDYAATNFIFTNGEFIWSLREVNENNRFVKEKKMMKYYSIFNGIDAKNNLTMISAEKLEINGIAWKQSKNHSLQEINMVTNKTKIYHY